MRRRSTSLYPILLYLALCLILAFRSQIAKDTSMPEAPLRFQSDSPLNGRAG